jgi:hypothetical protein
MNPIEVVKRYNKALNDHDTGALAVLFDQGAPIATLTLAKS